MPLYDVHPLLTIVSLVPCNRGCAYYIATTEKFSKNRENPSNTFPYPGIEPKTSCLAVALATIRTTRQSTNKPYDTKRKIAKHSTSGTDHRLHSVMNATLQSV
ncbi:hypothetical protein SFRURICE_002156 [Spodoptera frugiperda]|nr:hypothetical protein SFRURICE_002156 [Spodoptera frugiperda]